MFLPLAIMALGGPEGYCTLAIVAYGGCESLEIKESILLI